METLVVKVGGATGVDLESVCADIACLVRSARHSIVLVHGTSAAADALAERAGVPVRHLLSPSGHVSRYTDPEMLDIQLASVVEYMVIGYIVCVVLILAINFYKIRPKLTGDMRRWATFLTIGFFLFAIAGILDTVLSSEFIVIARIIMALSVIYIYKGFYVKETDVKTEERK